MRIFIDVREPAEFASGHVEGAINLPPSNLLDGNGLAEIPKDAELVLYCNSGSRSNVAMHIFQTHGFTKIVNGINKEHVKAKYF